MSLRHERKCDRKMLEQLNKVFGKEKVLIELLTLWIMIIWKNKKLLKN
jgi:hypothetical protein